MYYRFGKAFYFLSVLLFVFFLLYFYSAMPEMLSYQFDEAGLGLDQISRNTLFYGIIGIFVLSNFLILVPPKLLETKSHQGLHKIFPVGDSYRDYFLGWFYSFGGIVNLCLFMMVFYTHAINNQNEIAASKFNFFYYLIPVLFVVWVLGLFIILFGKFKQVRVGA